MLQKVPWPSRFQAKLLYLLKKNKNLQLTDVIIVAVHCFLCQTSGGGAAQQVTRSPASEKDLSSVRSSKKQIS